MTILYFLIPLALLLMAGALWALFWAIRTGQFDDLETQGWSVVLDEDRELPAAGEPEISVSKENADEREGTGPQK
jgi:cbb3-type cytochrome oxidase maturation protein